MCSILSIDATCFFQHYLRALSAKNANHLQTTDTLKRHRRYSIHYHCGWPSLWTWGSATHNGLPALPEPFLRACGLHRVCTRLKINQNSRAVLWCSGWFHVWVHLKKYHSPLFTPVGSTCVAHIFQKRLFQVDSCIQFYRLTQLLFSTSLKGIIRKNANHLQTTDTLKRHRRYSIHYHCGLSALPEPYLRACGLHRVCTRHKINQNSRAVLWCSGFYVFNFIDWRNVFFSTLLSKR